MKAKDYAVSLGLAKPGRGRMSLAAREAVEAAIAKGYVFEGYVSRARPDKPQKSVSVSVPKPAEPKDTAEGINMYADGWYRYDSDQEFAYDDDAGKSHIINGKAVCMTCKFSLVGHKCQSPVVLTRHGVRHVRLK